MDVRQFVGRLGKHQLTEWRQRTCAVSGQLADRVIVIAVESGPARVDVSVLAFVVSHVHIVAGAAAGGDTGQLLYAGQR
jgi:hypothetical protein